MGISFSLHSGSSILIISSRRERGVFSAIKSTTCTMTDGVYVKRVKIIITFGFPGVEEWSDLIKEEIDNASVSLIQQVIPNNIPSIHPTV